MDDNIQLAIQERNKYIDICKDIIIKEISKTFRALPLVSYIVFYMDAPEVNIPYRDNPIISQLFLYNSQHELIESSDSIGDLNLVLHLCGIGLIHLFSYGKVMVDRNHYVK